MPLAEEQLVRGWWQQDVHKTPDKKQAPQNRGLPPGNQSWQAQEHTPSASTPPSATATCDQTSHLLMCLRARLCPAGYLPFMSPHCNLTFALSSPTSCPFNYSFDKHLLRLERAYSPCFSERPSWCTCIKIMETNTQSAHSQASPQLTGKAHGLEFVTRPPGSTAYYTGEWVKHSRGAP